MRNNPGNSKQEPSQKKGKGFIDTIVHPFISWAQAAESKGLFLSAELVDRFFQSVFPAYIEATGKPVVFRELAELVSEPGRFSERLKNAVLSRKEITGKRLKARVFQYFNLFPITMRKRLRRPGDPAGDSMPASLVTNLSPELVCLFPRNVPQFLPGDRPVAGSSVELLELLHCDGLVETWKARHADLPQLPPVAVECFNTPQSAAAFRSLIVGLDLVSAVIGPTGISMAVKDVFLNNEPPCREVEHFEGKPLEDFWWGRCAKGDWSAEESQRLGLALTEALVKAHQSKVVHGALKPADVLLTEDSGVRIARFGLESLLSNPGGRANVGHTQVTEESVTVVASPYSSVQVLNGDRPEPRDDLYSLGVIWFQLCCGDMTAHPDQVGKWKRALVKRGVDPKVVRVIGACVDDARENRPESAQAIMDLLQGRKPEPPPVTPKVKKPEPEPRPILVVDDPTGLAEKEENRPDIFISYRKAASGDFVFRLHKLLKARGYKVFYDDESLKSGNWASTLRWMVSNSRDFLLVLGPNTFSNQQETGEDWVANEIDEAIRSSAGKRLKIIPVCHDTVSVEEIGLPSRYEELRKIQGVLFNTKKEKVFEAIFETDLVPALKSIPANSRTWWFSWFRSGHSGKPKKKKKKNSGVVSRGLLLLLLIAVPCIILVIVLYQPVREQMAKVLPAAQGMLNRGMAKVLPGNLGLRPFSYPDVQKFATTPVLDFKTGWRLLAKDKGNDLELFQHVVGWDDKRVLITTRLEVLEHHANNPGKFSLYHKENWNECDQIEGLFFNSSEEPIVFSFKRTGSNFLKITSSGVKRYPIPEDVAYDHSFQKQWANSFGCHSGSDVFLFDGERVSKKSGNPQLSFENQAIQLLPDYALEVQKALPKANQMLGFKLLWVHYPGFYAGSVHVNQDEVRVLDSSSGIESVRYEKDSRSGIAKFAFGESLEKFCVVTDSGAVYRRNAGKMDRVINPFPQDVIEDLWVSPTGKVYAISKKSLYILE